MDTRTRTSVGLVLVLVVVVAVIALSGRDGGSGATGRPDASGQLEVVLEDFEVDPAALHLTAGEPFTLVFVNRDEVSHHLSFGRQVVSDEGREAGYAEDLFADLDLTITPDVARAEPTVPGGGTTILVPAGRSVSVATTLPDERVGTWELGCFTGGGCSYRAGLAATIDVE